MQVWGISVFLFTVLGVQNALSKPSRVTFDASVDQIYSVLKENKAKNVEEAVALFDSEFFKPGNYRLFFESQSIQPGSKEFPRVVLSGKNSKLFIGFNHKLGEPRDLEFIQRNEKDKTWEFKEISFRGGKPSLSSLKNPRLCVQCHGGPDAKPNVLRFEPARLELSVPFPSFIRLEPMERERFWRDFVEKSWKDPVYSRLGLAY